MKMRRTAVCRAAPSVFGARRRPAPRRLPAAKKIAPKKTIEKVKDIIEYKEMNPVIHEDGDWKICRAICEQDARKYLGRGMSVESFWHRYKPSHSKLQWKKTHSVKNKIYVLLNKKHSAINMFFDVTTNKLYNVHISSFTINKGIGAAIIPKELLQKCREDSKKNYPSYTDYESYSDNVLREWIEKNLSLLSKTEHFTDGLVGKASVLLGDNCYTHVPFHRKKFLLHKNNSESLKEKLFSYSLTPKSKINLKTFIKVHPDFFPKVPNADVRRLLQSAPEHIGKLSAIQKEVIFKPIPTNLVLLKALLKAKTINKIDKAKVEASIKEILKINAARKKREERNKVITISAAKLRKLVASKVESALKNN